MLIIQSAKMVALGFEMPQQDDMHYTSFFCNHVDNAKS